MNTNNESRPVDVLAVMERARIRLDAAADHHAHEGNESQAAGYVGVTREMVEARAAVAELVEAAKELRGVSLVLGQSSPVKIAAANARVDAALAKFGGAA